MISVIVALGFPTQISLARSPLFDAPHKACTPEYIRQEIAAGREYAKALRTAARADIAYYLASAEIDGCLKEPHPTIPTWKLYALSIVDEQLQDDLADATQFEGAAQRRIDDSRRIYRELQMIANDPVAPAEVHRKAANQFTQMCVSQYPLYQQESQIRPCAAAASVVRDIPAKKSASSPILRIASKSGKTQSIAAKLACLTPNSDATTAKAIAPEYPDIDKQQGVSGTAVIRVDLDASGFLVNAAVASSSGDATLDAAALTAARASTYLPEKRNCQDVPGSFLFRAEFNN